MVDPCVDPHGSAGVPKSLFKKTPDLLTIIEPFWVFIFMMPEKWYQCPAQLVLRRWNNFSRFIKLFWAFAGQANIK
jgi:hypothetical protein